MTEESLISSAPAILAIGVGLWIVTLIGLSWATSDRATQLSKPWLRKTLLFVCFALGMWVLCESAMGMFHFQSFPTETYILLLFVFAALEILEGKRFLSAYLGLGVWHLAVIVFVLEGIFGIFLADPLIPRTQDEFDREIAVGWPYEIPRKKPEGTFRVFALADSFGQVHRSENYHYLVHNRFAESTFQVEILNVSISAIEPTDQLELLSRFGKEFKPDLVLHSFYVGNDFTLPPGILEKFGGILVRRHKGIEGLQPRNFLLPNWVGRRAEVAIEQARRMEQEESGGPTGTFSRDEFLEIEKNRMLAICTDQPFTREILLRTLPVLNSMRAESIELGAEYVMAFLPDQFQVEDDLYQEILKAYSIDPKTIDRDLPQKILKDYCIREGIPYLDLLPYFRDMADQSLFLLDDTHYNMTGNKILADRLYEFLLEGWVQRLQSDRIPSATNTTEIR